MAEPLDDLSVIEITQMVAGSFVGMHLSDYGADVVKFEAPGRGDLARNIDPSVGGASFYYMSVNRGKRSVTVDLKSEPGRDVFLELVEQADVVVENLTPGTADRLGVGYESVCEKNPGIIYCSISAYGQTGPKRHKSGIDTMVQAYTGVSAMTRDADGYPLRCGLPIADLAGSMYAIQAVLMAIIQRERTGTGDYIDVALSDSLLSFLSVRASYTFATNQPFPSIAKHHVYFVPEGIFETADGYIQLSAVTQAHWEQLCRALDRRKLLNDPRFESAEARRNHRDTLIDLINSELAAQGTRYWIRRFDKFDVPAEQVYNVQEVWEDDHTQARDMLSTVSTPTGDRFPTISPPVKHRSLSPSAKDYIARLGADTVSILGELGYTNEEIAELEEIGAVQLP